MAGAAWSRWMGPQVEAERLCLSAVFAGAVRLGRGQQLRVAACLSVLQDAYAGSARCRKEARPAEGLRGLCSLEICPIIYLFEILPYSPRRTPETNYSLTVCIL